MDDFFPKSDQNEKTTNKRYSVNQEQHKTPVGNTKIKWLKTSDKYKTRGRKDICIHRGTKGMTIKICLSDIL